MEDLNKSTQNKTGSDNKCWRGQKCAADRIISSRSVKASLQCHTDWVKAIWFRIFESSEHLHTHTLDL